MVAGGRTTTALSVICVPQVGHSHPCVPNTLQSRVAHGAHLELVFARSGGTSRVATWSGWSWACSGGVGRMRERHLDLAANTPW